MKGRRQGAWWLLLALASASAWAWWRADQGLVPAVVWPASASPVAAEVFGSPPDVAKLPKADGGLVRLGPAAAQQDDASALPKVEALPVSPSFVAASMGALRSHGVRLDQAQVSLHTVQAVDLSVARQVRQWASAQGFVTPPLVKVFEHGGEVNWVVPIERHGVLKVERIVADAQAIQQRIAQFNGARYHSWQVPLGERATIARSGASPER